MENESAWRDHVGRGCGAICQVFQRAEAGKAPVDGGAGFAAQNRVGEKRLGNALARQVEPETTPLLFLLQQSVGYPFLEQDSCIILRYFLPYLLLYLSVHCAIHRYPPRLPAV
ncbi:hypothetical protein [Collimonas pratensis]|uniref:hypothetical protein n=1 Tax=Collimonas pratensis TaxID=279113 RepID=UPI00123741A1|nr:hypothetical protein [Collimonas pratensis]